VHVCADVLSAVHRFLLYYCLYMRASANTGWAAVSTIKVNAQFIVLYLNTFDANAMQCDAMRCGNGAASSNRPVTVSYGTGRE